jgi:hypothetical protein
LDSKLTKNDIEIAQTNRSERVNFIRSNKRNPLLLKEKYVNMNNNKLREIELKSKPKERKLDLNIDIDFPSPNEAISTPPDPAAQFKLRSPPKKFQPPNSGVNFSSFENTLITANTIKNNSSSTSKKDKFSSYDIDNDDAPVRSRGKRYTDDGRTLYTERTINIDNIRNKFEKDLKTVNLQRNKSNKFIEDETISIRDLEGSKRDLNIDNNSRPEKNQEKSSKIVSLSSRKVNLNISSSSKVKTILKAAPKFPKRI